MHINKWSNWTIDEHDCNRNLDDWAYLFGTKKNYTVEKHGCNIKQLKSNLIFFNTILFKHGQIRFYLCEFLLCKWVSPERLTTESLNDTLSSDSV